MIFFSRRKKITVDFISCDYKAYEFFSIDRSNKFIPQWWKDIPQEYHDDRFKTKGTRINSMKRCPGFMDIYRYSYTMPLWTSCEIILDDRLDVDGYYATSGDGTEIDSHPAKQAGNFISSNSLIHFKFQSPWLGYSAKNRDLLWNWSPASWNNPDLLTKLFIPTGFRNFRGGSGTNIHSFMDKSKNNVVSFDAGIPMIHMVPMTDKKVSVQCHYDPDWYEKISSSLPKNFSHNSVYYSKRKHMK